MIRGARVVAASRRKASSEIIELGAETLRLRTEDPFSDLGLGLCNVTEACALFTSLITSKARPS